MVSSIVYISVYNLLLYMYRGTYIKVTIYKDLLRKKEMRHKIERLLA